MAKKTKTQISREIQSIDEVAQQQREVKALQRPLPKANDADTRQTIAKLFVIVYFGLLTLILLGVPLYDLAAYNKTGSDATLQISLTDAIQTYAAVVGPTLGFVVAYYFKSKNDQ